MCMQTPIYWWLMFLRRIYWPLTLTLTNQIWEGLIIPIFPSYSMGWMQPEISFRSSSCVKNTIGHVMKYLLIRKMRSLKVMLKRLIPECFCKRSRVVALWHLVICASCYLKVYSAVIISYPTT